MDAGDVFNTAREIAGEVTGEAKKFLASEQGRKIRHYAATGLILAAPMAASLPGIRKTRLAKLIEVGGGAALITRVAEVIRDWEPQPPESA